MFIDHIPDDSHCLSLIGSVIKKFNIKPIRKNYLSRLTIRDVSEMK